jgi:hypothetical protein
VWTLEQQAAYAKQGIWPIAGNAPPYIEDVFSTYLYTGNDSTQNIVNGIDLAGKGGLVWLKGRSLATGHYLYDTVRGIANGPVSSENTNAAYTANTPKTLTTFNSNGFSMQDDSASFGTNVSPRTYVSWTFREQPKFFDVVTYTGTGSNTTIAHSLGSVPGCIIVKRTDTTADWAVYHRSLANTQYLVLNIRDPVTTGATWWNSTTPTSAVFSVGTDASVNASGGTYVAYVYAHDAGGFGLTGTDNVISCGSYTTNGSGAATINLGYEPQFVLEKSTGTSSWWLSDTMRGMSETNDIGLFPNSSAAESSVGSAYIVPKATGFDVAGHGGSATYIYIAIRRGPMKVPTDGTKVFAPITTTATDTNSRVISSFGFPLDLLIANGRSGSIDHYVMDRLRGATRNVYTSNTQAEGGTGAYGASSFASMTGYTQGTSDSAGWDSSTYTPFVFYGFKRAPSFFDEVCYSGTGAIGNAVSHNLGVAPELMIIKGRAGTIGTNDWQVLGKINAVNYVKLVLNADSAELGPFTYAVNAGLAAQPTSTTFTVNNTANFNNGSTTYVAYLFATCAGVSKVGTYTGTGATQTVACGFGAGGARFVLVKRTDTTGDWYVWDSARGMVSGTDPSLLLNSTAAEVNANSIYTISTGFQIVSTAAGINASGGTYIFLAIA